MSFLAGLFKRRLTTHDRYLVYLRSEAWRRKCERILRRDHYQCQTCLESVRLEVHHKTYARLYHERDEDLITLCRKCHRAIERAKGRKLETA